MDTNGFEIDLDDDHSVNFGNDDDLKINHSGTNGSINNYTGDLVIRTLGNNADDIFIDSKSDVDIRVDTADNAIKCISNGAVKLYHNGSEKLQTQADGIYVTGKIQPTSHIYQNDNLKHHWGSSQDLSIYHSSSDNNSYIEESGTGHLVVKADDFYIQDAGANHTQIKSDSDNTVQLSFNGTAKLQTTTDGAKVLGTGNFVLPSGTTAQRGSAATGSIRYNTTTNQLEVYNGSAWSGVGASSPQIYKVTNTTNYWCCRYKYGYYWRRFCKWCNCTLHGW